jgi:hypothetical protein
MISAPNDDERQPSLVVLPSLESDKALGVGLHATGSLMVGSIAGTMRPADLLQVLGSGRRPDVHIYSDQLVSVEDATIPIKHLGRCFFLSSVEVILVSQYGYRASVWSVDGFLAAETPEDVVALLVRYLEQCANQRGWLAASLQSQRSLETRVATAELELRRLQDAALCAWAMRGRRFDPGLLAVLEQSTEALRRLRTM